jgi:hypothetical protein|tara:strand:+ start:1343 stop:1609 length:267 start_codon:yes stop_codon:yes gene_type:complete
MTVRCLSVKERQELASHLDEEVGAGHRKAIEDFFDDCEKGRTKKRLSGYNIYISECVKTDKKDFKSCATGWKQMSADEQQGYRDRAAT